MSQIIIIDRVAALSEQIEQTYLHHGSMKIKQAVLVCLHPIEVPDDAVELAKAVEAAIKPSYIESPNGRGGVMIISKDYSDAAALITAHSRTVPRAMLEEIIRAAAEVATDPIARALDECVNYRYIAAKHGYKVEE